MPRLPDDAVACLDTFSKTLNFSVLKNSNSTLIGKDRKKHPLRKSLISKSQKQGLGRSWRELLWAVGCLVPQQQLLLAEFTASIEGKVFQREKVGNLEVLSSNKRYRSF